MLPPPLKAGDGLTLEYMNRTGDEIAAGRLAADPRSGLRICSTPFGSFLQALLPAEGWFQVTGSGGGGSGSYALREQVDGPAGAWSDGLKVVATAYETNLNASVPTGKRVWAIRRRGSWRFTWGACS